MSRAARRMTTGVQKAKPGQTGLKGTRLPGKLPKTRRKVLVDRLAACQEWERDGIREYLREQKTPLAASLLTELEGRWAGDARE